MILKRLWIFPVVLWLLVYISLPARADEKVAFQYRLTAGQQFLMTSTTQNKSQAIINDKTIRLDETNDFQLLCQVTAVDGQGNIEATLTYTGIKVTSNGNVVYDSAKQTEEEKSSTVQGYEALLNRSFIIRFTPTGKVLVVKGFNDLWEELTAELEEPVSELVKENLQKQFGDETFKKVFEQALAIFPEHPVALGDKWTHKTDLSGCFPQSTELIYCLNQRHEGLALLRMKAVIRSDAEGQLLDMGGVSMRFWLSGTMEGNLEVEEKTGLVIKYESKTKTFGSMELSMPGLEQALSGPVSMEVLSLIKMEELKPDSELLK